MASRYHLIQRGQVHRRVGYDGGHSVFVDDLLCALDLQHQGKLIESRDPAPHLKTVGDKYRDYLTFFAEFGQENGLKVIFLFHFDCPFLIFLCPLLVDQKSHTLAEG